MGALITARLSPQKTRPRPEFPGHLQIGDDDDLVCQSTSHRHVATVCLPVSLSPRCGFFHGQTRVRLSLLMLVGPSGCATVHFRCIPGVAASHHASQGAQAFDVRGDTDTVLRCLWWPFSSSQSQTERGPERSCGIKHTRELITARKTSHKHNIKDLSRLR